MFEGDKNVDTKKNNRIIVDSNYNSNDIWKAIYLAISYAFFIESKGDCYLFYILNFLWFIKTQLLKLNGQKEVKKNSILFNKCHINFQLNF